MHFFDDFLSYLTFNSSVKRTRSNNLFYSQSQHTNYLNNLLFISLMKIVNELKIDLFTHLSFFILKLNCGLELIN